MQDLKIYSGKNNCQNRTQFSITLSSLCTGLEMVSKLSQLDENEYVLTEKLDTNIYQEIAKYLTIQDIQLIVSSLEALYQLSELGEATTSKIAEVSNTVGK